ncbi:MAG: hypothetical protein EA367_14165 [Leptolyngbya sp. DLM2.Bin15]|nr:MAG: hypothetical protein EA367_14165 [Leptolyngbya sp. DLM2.Bin15]
MRMRSVGGLNFNGVPGFGFAQPSSHKGLSIMKLAGFGFTQPSSHEHLSIEQRQNTSCTHDVLLLNNPRLADPVPEAELIGYILLGLSPLRIIGYFSDQYDFLAIK